MPSSTHTIADLLDYEAQLAQDALQPIQALVQRDRAIGQSARANADRHALLSLWLEAMRAQNPRLPGRAWVQTHRFTTFACIVLGIMSGSGFMRTLLAYDGTHPVNILYILGFFVGLQIFFLTLLAFRSLAGKALKRSGVGPVAEILLRWLRINLKDVFRRENDTTRAAQEFFRRFHSLHAPLEAAIAMTFFQTFVFAFHLAAFVTFLFTVTVSDIAFSWATTTRFTAPIFHDVLRAVATPFAWIGSLVPDFAFVEATQYSRLEKRYISDAHLTSGIDPGAWWSFLAACIFTYGVLPRFILILWGRHKIRRYLRRHVFSDHASSALLARLTQPAGVWSATGTSSTIPTAHLDESTLKRIAATQTDAPCLVLKWFGFPAHDDVLKTFLTETFQVEVAAVLNASGTAADLAKIQKALTDLAKHGSPPRLVIAADPWEAPGEAAERMLSSLRSPPFDQLICLFAPLVVEGDELRVASEKDVAIWRQSLLRYRDPYAGLIVDLGGMP